VRYETLSSSKEGEQVSKYKDRSGGRRTFARFVGQARWPGKEVKSRPLSLSGLPCFDWIQRFDGIFFAKF
jgi:hypothetical protein